MSLPKFPDWREGDPWSVEVILEMLAYMRALRPLSGGALAPHFTPNGWWAEAAGGSSVGLIRGQVTASIASGSSGTVTLYKADHTLGSQTITAFNRSGNTVNSGAATKVVYVAYMPREAEYQVVIEAC
jgi:hypothetical protein